ncbi:MAG: peptide chain release factor 1 [Myxococcales bacterium]|nr:peptide chain release factor 1 [Myxococcales bacterium]
MLPIDKLEELAARHSHLEGLLCEADVLSDPKRFAALNKEHAELSAVVHAYREYTTIERQLQDDRIALADPELRDMALEEIPELETKLTAIAARIAVLLIPSDPNDARNTILEIRSGTGGQEAALFAADLFRMYGRYAEGMRWKIELMSSSPASAGGLKEVIVLIAGAQVYSHLRFEGGVHRVQRIPATETQGRIHTSTATVAVLPEADEVEVHIDDADLEISIAASGGPGGQGVNTTNSAVQIQHKPTGIIVKCQDERSQIKNKAKAMKILRSRILKLQEQAQADAVAAERRDMVGSGERAEKIRTYNFPQNRVTDHRLGLTLHKLDHVMDGDLVDLITALRSQYQAALLHKNS